MIPLPACSATPQKLKGGIEATRIGVGSPVQSPVGQSVAYGIDQMDSRKNQQLASLSESEYQSACCRAVGFLSLASRCLHRSARPPPMERPADFISCLALSLLRASSTLASYSSYYPFVARHQDS